MLAEREKQFGALPVTCSCRLVVGAISFSLPLWPPDRSPSRIWRCRPRPWPWRGRWSPPPRLGPGTCGNVRITKITCCSRKKSGWGHHAQGRNRCFGFLNPSKVGESTTDMKLEKQPEKEEKKRTDYVQQPAAGNCKRVSNIFFLKKISTRNSLFWVFLSDRKGDNFPLVQENTQTSKKCFWHIYFAFGTYCSPPSPLLTLAFFYYWTEESKLIPPAARGPLHPSPSKKSPTDRIQSLLTIFKTSSKKETVLQEWISFFGRISDIFAWLDTCSLS